MIITTHVLVKNEVNFIWYSVMSVIKHVDRVRIWDTGSTDGTLEVINKLRETEEGRKKILFEYHPIEVFDEEKQRQRMLDSESIGAGDAFEHIREAMLEATVADWFLVLDGDEIWWEDSIIKLTETIRRNNQIYESVVVPTINAVGDIFHYQEKEAGNYNLAGRVGHYNLRAVNRKIEGLHSKGAHGVWGWADNEGKQIQYRDPKKILYLDTPYLHCTFLERTRNRSFAKGVLKRSFKYKHEIGENFSNDFYYPEVFFRPRPDIVPSPWKKMSKSFYFISLLESPLRKVKRRVLPKRVGY